MNINLVEIRMLLLFTNLLTFVYLCLSLYMYIQLNIKEVRRLSSISIANQLQSHATHNTAVTIHTPSKSISGISKNKYFNLFL